MSNIKKSTIRGEESKFFRGEMMICKLCGKQPRSNPKKSSDWTVVETDGVAIYICPKCWFGKMGGAL
jgi:ribosome-binding protein aMBF1 (putative translation factor)